MPKAIIVCRIFVSSGETQALGHSECCMESWHESQAYQRGHAVLHHKPRASRVTSLTVATVPFPSPNECVHINSPDRVHVRRSFGSRGREVSMDNVKDIWFHIHDAHEGIYDVQVRELVNRIWLGYGVVSVEDSGSQGVRLQDIWPINQPTNAAKMTEIRPELTTVQLLVYKVSILTLHKLSRCQVTRKLSSLSFAAVPQ
jgi:hypothetical protein